MVLSPATRANVIPLQDVHSSCCFAIRDCPPQNRASFTDPLQTLGSDIFHLVISKLSISTLVAAEQVSKAWWLAIRNNGAVWRQSAIHGGAETADILRLDALPKCPRQWRDLCVNQLPATQGWRAGMPKRISAYSLDPVLSVQPTRKAFVPLPAVNAVITLDSNGRTIAFDTGFRISAPLGMTYKAMVTCGDYFVGADWGNTPRDLQETSKLMVLDIWRILPGRNEPGAGVIHLPGGVMKLVKAMSLSLWGFDIALHLGRGKTTPTLAILGAEPRLFESDPATPHWVASRRRAIHIYDLDSGTSQVIPLAPKNGFSSTLAHNDTHVLVPDDLQLNIYSRATSALVSSIPLTPVGAALAVPITQFVKLNSARSVPQTRDERTVWEAAHALAYPHQRPREFAQAAFTASGEIVYSANGALVILRNTADLLKKLETSASPAIDASAHSVLISSTVLFQHIQVLNDRILAQTRSSILMLDLDSVPIPAMPAPQSKVDPLSLSSPRPPPTQPHVFHLGLKDNIRNTLLHADGVLPACDGPLLRARMASIPGLEGAIMTPTSIYLPTAERIPTRRTAGSKTALRKPGPIIAWRFGDVSVSSDNAV